MAHLTEHFHEPAVALDDDHDRGESQAGSLPVFLGGKKRFKNPLHQVRGYADAGVRNAQDHVRTEEWQLLHSRLHPLQHDVVRFNRKTATVRQRVARINAQIQQHLVQLRGISQDRSKAIRQFRCDVDRPRESLLCQHRDLVHQVPDLE